ncbi:hypothetical protein FKP32DRAFT_1558770, partial [Trametes sanguinea]
MYGDRRFQYDRTYSYVAFSQEQVRNSTSGGYLLTSRGNFPDVAEKILSVDMTALDSIIRRSASGLYVSAESEEEKKCFELMSLIDHVAGNVHGSNARRKFQRNEIKSLIFTHGVPVFFVTFAPADMKSPICLKMCGEEIDITKGSFHLSEGDRLLRIAKNPVGAARFFHKTVEALLRVMLRVGSEEDGIFGRTAAYYGTVE